MNPSEWLVLISSLVLLCLVSGFLMRKCWRTGLVMLISLGGWMAITALLAHSGWLGRFDATPPRFAFLVLGTFGLALVLAFSPFGERVCQLLSLRTLILFHSFRFIPELQLWLAYQEGLAPVQMSIEGLNYDAFSAVSALIIGLVLDDEKLMKWGKVWSWFALLLLLNILIIAILSTPTALRMFHNEPANTFVATFPSVWLPATHVLLALMGHILVFRKIRAQNQV